MSPKIFPIVIAAVCAVALTAAPAYARGGQRSTVVMNLVPSGDASAACPGSLFGLAFDLTSPSGERLGTGRSCVDSIVGCDPFPRCHQTVHATLTFDLARGSVTVPATLQEVWPDESSFVQFGHGVHQQRIRATMTWTAAAPAASPSRASRAGSSMCSG